MLEYLQLISSIAPQKISNHHLQSLPACVFMPAIFTNCMMVARKGFLSWTPKLTLAILTPLLSVEGTVDTEVNGKEGLDSAAQQY